MPNTAFDYRLRVSPRGKNVRLRVTVKHGLEVVIPRGYNTENIPSILERKKGWVRSALDRVRTYKRFFNPPAPWVVPDEIHLPALGQIWFVEAKPTSRTYARITKAGEGRLLLVGPIDNQRTCQQAMTRWLMRQTRESLVPRLRRLSRELGLPFERVFVNRARTRWASCSRKRSISLNAKLLFLPPEVVDYVIIHELCHLVELNHSERFWELVMRHCPQYRRLDGQLREMWKAVPCWALGGVAGAEHYGLANDRI